MTNPHDQLTALFTLATEWPGGIEECPWWDDWVCLWQDGEWYYGDERCCADMKKQHALDLVTAEAERWLKKQDDELVWCWREQGYISLLHGYDCFADTLIDALKYAKEQA